MPFDWTERQFVGGALCLDLANTVYYADDPARRGDRLRDGPDIAAWLAASRRFGSAGRYAPLLTVRPADYDTAATVDTLLLRQSVDDLFRAIAAGMPPPALAMRPIHYALGAALDALGLTLAAGGVVPSLGPAAAPSPATVRAAVAHSALALALSQAVHRLRICPGCGWLFVDRSRNASRVWCDMLTCGNRAKAHRHHGARRRPVLTVVDDVGS